MKNIPGYEELYAVTEDGKVWTYKKNRWLHSHINKGYVIVTLIDKNKKRYKVGVHRLVALTYLENPNNYPTVDHIDRNPLNNNVTNLRWASIEMQIENRDNDLIVKYALINQQLGAIKVSKAVEQRDKENHDIILNTFTSSLQAAIILFNDPMKNSLINRCAQGKKNSAYGYYWTFVKPAE